MQISQIRCLKWRPHPIIIILPLHHIVLLTTIPQMKTDIKNFLTGLIEAQDQTLAALHKKQSLLVRPEKEALDSIAAEEEATLEKMQHMLTRREEILTAARLQNIRCDSIEQLCEHFFPRNVEVQKLLNEIKSRAQQIQLLAYTNWTLGRKSQIHFSQLLELVETRLGQGKKTYSQQSKNDASGGWFVDRVA